MIGQGFWRRASGGIVFEPRKKLVLCHRRSTTKDERPDLWVSTFGGKCRKHEQPDEAASRELLEEFGISSRSGSLRFLSKFKSFERRQFEYLFLVFVNADIAHINCDANEVAEYAWLSVPDVQFNLKRNKFWYAYGYEMEILAKAEAIPSS